MTVSQCFGQGEKVLLHANVGGNFLFNQDQKPLIGTWGFGTQVKTIGGLFSW
jgi:hypothetical protein